MAWDLVAPTHPTRTYAKRPRPQAGHAAIFGDPTHATEAMGKACIEVIVDALEKTFKNIKASYEER